MSQTIYLKVLSIPHERRPPFLMVFIHVDQMTSSLYIFGQHLKFAKTCNIRKMVIFQHKQLLSQKNIYIYICYTLRSELHEIPTIIRTFPCGLENNHACKRISDNFPGMMTYVLFLENCQKSIYMHGCSSIHGERSFFFFKVWDRFVPLI